MNRQKTHQKQVSKLEHDLQGFNRDMSFMRMKSTIVLSVTMIALLGVMNNACAAPLAPGPFDPPLPRRVPAQLRRRRGRQAPLRAHFAGPRHLAPRPARRGLHGLRRRACCPADRWGRARGVLTPPDGSSRPCSQIFLYILTSMGIRSSLQKALGFEPPKAGSGTSPFAPPAQ